MVRNTPVNAGDTGLIPDPGRSHMFRTTRPVCHNYLACALEPGNCNYRGPRALALVLCNKGSYWNEKPAHCNRE